MLIKNGCALLLVTLLGAGCRPPRPAPVPAAPPATPIAARPPDLRPARFEALKRSLKALAGRAPGRGVAFWVEDRLIGRRWAHNPDRVMRSASLIKIPVAALALKRWREKPFRRTPALEKRVWRMIAESHNVSTDVVVDHLGGLGPVNRFCVLQGWTHTRMNHKMMAWRTRKAHNLTTARDVASMLRGIDAGELVDREVSSELWELLKDQKIVDRIPAGLPKGAPVDVGSKTGTMLSVVHDAAIVRGPGVRYLLVIMIDGPRSEAGADAYCRRVSAAVYQALRPPRGK
jgi:beta-lactamase class A